MKALDMSRDCLVETSVARPQCSTWLIALIRVAHAVFLSVRQRLAAEDVAKDVRQKPRVAAEVPGLVAFD